MHEQYNGEQSDEFTLFKLEFNLRQVVLYTMFATKVESVERSKKQLITEASGAQKETNAH